jgi:peptidyl-prolyl cis-trans isomerase SDCCAG10
MGIEEVVCLSGGFGVRVPGFEAGFFAGGQSIYGAPFADEFHSRLRFNHRGLVACANAGTPHSNGSQFFITLDRCDWLDKKNTIFGKVPFLV